MINICVDWPKMIWCYECIWTSKSGHCARYRKAVNETLEDYTLRYAPHSAGVPKLLLLLHLVVLPILFYWRQYWYVLWNNQCCFLFAAIIIFLTGIPLAYYAITSTLTWLPAAQVSVILSYQYHFRQFHLYFLCPWSMAQGLLLGLGIPLWAGYQPLWLFHSSFTAWKL